jgi:hypothetical protein
VQSTIPVEKLEEIIDAEGSRAPSEVESTTMLSEPFSVADSDMKQYASSIWTWGVNNNYVKIYFVKIISY